MECSMASHRRLRLSTMLAALLLCDSAIAAAQRGNPSAADSIKYRYASTSQLDALKAEAAREIDGKAKMIQEMVDQVFSYGELGFQEFETSKYLSNILEQNGFKVERGVAGIPTAWVARWGSGKPVISVGSGLHDIPKAGQEPGVGYKDPIVAAAPGHGEGHNSGMPLNVAAALVVKKIMERDHIQGTLVLWPGVAEELMSGKAWLVREGVFKDVDVTLFTHVGNDLSVSWGQSSSNALISAIFKFKGASAHAAGPPWGGKSVLVGGMVMGAAVGFLPGHNELAQRSPPGLPRAGVQPNLLPINAGNRGHIRRLRSH